MSDPRASVQTTQWTQHADRVAQAVKRLGADDVLARLWDRDASLWSAEPAVQAAIRDRLGWLSITGVMARETQMLRRLAQELRGDGLTHALLLGMGGSALFPEVCRRTFGVAAGHLDVTVLDSGQLRPAKYPDDADSGCS